MAIKQVRCWMLDVGCWIKPNIKYLQSKIKNYSGVSLVELMVAVAVIGIISGMASAYLIQTVRFYRLNKAKIEIQRDARTYLSLINRYLRQAQANSIVISNEANQPPHSKLSFTTIGGTAYTFYQEGQELNMTIGTMAPKTVSENLRYVAFTLPRTDDFTIVSISMTFEKTTYQGASKALQLSIEKVRVMN
ncbi:PilW family protein [Elusimicrobiota bacterium]